MTAHPVRLRCQQPEGLYGDYFQSAARYHADYITLEDGQVSEHPFFNEGLTLTEAEDRLLSEYSGRPAPE